MFAAELSRDIVLCGDVYTSLKPEVPQKWQSSKNGEVVKNAGIYFTPPKIPRLRNRQEVPNPVALVAKICMAKKLYGLYSQ